MEKIKHLFIDQDWGASNLVSDLSSKGYKLSDWIIDISSRLHSELKNEYEIWSVSLKDLGFTGPTKLEDVYEQFHLQGFSDVPPEIALILRMHVEKHPTNEWMRVLTPIDSMIDKDGIPHLPKLGSGLGNLYIETYWAWPQAIFHPHNEFLVQKVVK